jgi:hypothetical protein
MKMKTKAGETKEIASRLLAGMLANPNIYPNISDTGATAQPEQKLISVSIEMAKDLIKKVESMP